MIQSFGFRVLNSSADNRKSKTCTEPRRSIENLKWLGILVSFVGWVGMAQAQQSTKVPRIGYLSGNSAFL